MPRRPSVAEVGLGRGGRTGISGSGSCITIPCITIPRRPSVSGPECGGCGGSSGPGSSTRLPRLPPVAKVGLGRGGRTGISGSGSCITMPRLP
ncbi:unnamed protein product [Linum tenue]|uniref:Uncharacterized protein n=1 Tax=Linum tenue TaxID=586396 RepID=A0AAV0PB79_9ROSI|nr:unnamed protein product [Linum tenue]